MTFNLVIMYNKFIKIKTNLNHMLIFIQRGTSVPFFLRFFRGFAPFRRFGTAKDSRFGCRRVTADSSGLPPWCGESLLRQGILTVLSLYSSVERAGVKRISFCCGQKERNATKTKSVGLSCRFCAAKDFYGRGFWLCPNDNGGGGDSCLRCRRKPYI